jgi:hypothetical protein
MLSLCVIRPKSLGVKGPIFVHVTIHISNIKTSLRVDRPRRKSDGGLSSTKTGKGEGAERLERGAKPKVLSPRE